MSRILKSIVILLCATFSFSIPAHADDQPTNKYPETGAVLSTASDGGHFYQVSTESRVYLLLCNKVKTFHLGPPECRVGDKPIAASDIIHFRIDGDWAYMAPVAEGMEEKLRVLTTELRVIPPMPLASPKPKDEASKQELEQKSKQKPKQEPVPAVAIGSGMQVKGQHGVGWSTTPSRIGGLTTASGATPVIATGPVTAIPVTGGAPVLVVPTGPTTGGVITGVPVTGGAPITAIPTAPVMGFPVGGAPAGGGVLMMGARHAPQWVHVIRVQTADKIFQLECSRKPCSMGNKEIALGEALSLRADKKHAYLSDPAGSVAEQEYKILGVTDVGAASKAKQN